jgi:acyl-coenzyme A thioesterase PaaI-like protein
MVKDGELICEATPEHIGRSTHIWSATVTDKSGKKVALFRCTQMVLQPEQGNLNLKKDVLNHP